MAWLLKMRSSHRPRSALILSCMLLAASSALVRYILYYNIVAMIMMVVAYKNLVNTAVYVLST